MLARVAAREELQAVRGADGLLEEALLAQQLLDGIILPHSVLLYDLQERPLVTAGTGMDNRLRSRQSHQGNSVWGLPCE